jgi:hypothetical protein
VSVLTFHETREDRDRERAVAEWFAKAWGLQAFEMPETYVLDYTFHLGDPLRSDVRFFAEIRTRRCEWGTYPDVFLNMKKLQYADWLRTQGFKTLFLVNFKCGTMAWTELIRPSGFRVAGRAKSNMRNSEDVEPLCYFNNDRFEVLHEGERGVQKA